jgi:hypothetical protein
MKLLTLTKEQAINIYIAACVEQASNPFRVFGTIVYRYLPVELSAAINGTQQSMLGLTDPEEVKIMLFNLTEGEQ